MKGVPYMHFVVPGLVMMAIVTNAYTTHRSLFSNQILRTLHRRVVGLADAALAYHRGFRRRRCHRGVIVGALGTPRRHALTGLTLGIINALIILLFAVLTALLFSLAGLVNGVYAKSFDAINIVPNAVLQPPFTRGIFYSVHSLRSSRSTSPTSIPSLSHSTASATASSDLPTYQLDLHFHLLAFSWLSSAHMYLIRTGLGLKQLHMSESEWIAFRGKSREA